MEAFTASLGLETLFRSKILWSEEKKANVLRVYVAKTIDGLPKTYSTPDGDIDVEYVVLTMIRGPGMWDLDGEAAKKYEDQVGVLEAITASAPVDRVRVADWSVGQAEFVRGFEEDVAKYKAAQAKAKAEKE